MGLCHPLSSYLPGSAFVKYGKIDQMVMAIGLHNQYNILYIYTLPSIHIYIYIYIYIYTYTYTYPSHKGWSSRITYHHHWLLHLFFPCTFFKRKLTFFSHMEDLLRGASQFDEFSSQSRFFWHCCRDGFPMIIPWIIPINHPLIIHQSSINHPSIIH